MPFAPGVQNIRIDAAAIVSYQHTQVPRAVFEPDFDARRARVTKRVDQRLAPDAIHLVANQRMNRAHAAFDFVLKSAPEAHLWFLHAALEKQQEARVVRGSWGGAGALTCPLSALVLGHAPRDDEQAGEAAIASEDLLREAGMHARDFTNAWDLGLIPAWRLLRRIDAEITRRLLSERRARKD